MYSAPTSLRIVNVKSVVLFTALVASAVFARTGAAATPPVTVVSPATLTVPAAGAEPMTVMLRNDRSHDVTLRLTTLLDQGSATVTPDQATIAAYTVSSLGITITADTSDRDATGEVVFTAAGAPPAVLPLVVQPQKSYNDAAAVLIFVPLLAAIALVSVLFAVVDVKAPFGPANWDYSQSWATTLTVVGAFLGTVLGAGVLPDNLLLFSKAGYSGFNLLFGLLVLLAPLVYAAAQKRIADAANGTPQYQGTSWAFGCASVATLWGVFGELATIALLFRELEKSARLSTVLVYALWAVLGIVVVVAVAYVVRRMRTILASPAAPAGMGLAAPAAGAGWSLL